LKTLISLAIVSLFSMSAFAETVVLKCVVPVQSGQPQVLTEVTIGADASLDFVTVDVQDLKQTFTFFAQLEKGQLDTEVKSGQVSFLPLSDKSAQDAGVIREAGFFALSKDANGSFSGFISAVGNVYPLQCQLN
jgi:hypothetical protein